MGSVADYQLVSDGGLGHCAQLVRGEGCRMLRFCFGCCGFVVSVVGCLLGVVGGGWCGVLVGFVCFVVCFSGICLDISAHGDTHTSLSQKLRLCVCACVCVSACAHVFWGLRVQLSCGTLL